MIDSDSQLVELDFLHDAIIETIHYEWTGSTVTIPMWLCTAAEPRENACTLIARNVTNVVIPHHSPWGETFYVNEVLIHKHASSVTIELEMQSGDIIRIDASTYEAAVLHRDE